MWAVDKPGSILTPVSNTNPFHIFFPKIMATRKFKISAVVMWWCYYPGSIRAESLSRSESDMSQTHSFKYMWGTATCWSTMCQHQSEVASGCVHSRGKENHRQACSLLGEEPVQSHRGALSPTGWSGRKSEVSSSAEQAGPVHTILVPPSITLL